MLFRSPRGWAEVSATVAPAPMPAPAPEPAAPPAASTGPTLRLVWMGDIMLDDGPGRVIAQGQDPFADVASLLRQADLRIGNLECVIARGGQRIAKPWTFRAHPRTLPLLQRHVDVVSLANNHSGDFGPQAFAEMLGRLDAAGLPYFGGGRDLRQAHQPRIIVRQGLRIALLGYNEMFPRRFEAGDFELRLVNLREPGQRHFADASGLENMELTRHLRSGEPLAASDLRPALLVLRGQPVVLSVGNPAGMAITVRVEALQDGRMGEQIRVRNPESGRLLSGMVTGPGMVRGL